ncbi:DUF3226 domain-containing protein [Tumebacillus flagellatus]|uniref:Uncharacterized protein n=1 Tax=Tumebacillus flagellatus TaxID=1157490 RepID=A0A074LQ73_9BACL|nr:DUF3226 domain-containing protein [Tumebacillus flagellatus]KEO83249.1 hypothetical protein EL26_11200 [Tumebacillus flagellatus]
MRYHYLVVEGPHDAAAVGKILELLGARQIKKLMTLTKLDVERYLEHLTKLDFPYNDDMTERIPVPLFFRYGDLEDLDLIAVHAVGGESALVKTMAATLSNLDDNGDRFTSLSIMGDADGRTPSEAMAYYQEKLQELPSPSSVMAHFANFPSPGLVIERRQRIGVYVLPDNEKTGTLETVLLECAAATSQEIQAEAEKYVDRFSSWSDSKRDKAIVGCMNNLLRPGTSNTVSIAKDDWFCPDTMSLSSAAKLQYFLKQLLGLEPCSAEA